MLPFHMRCLKKRSLWLFTGIALLAGLAYFRGYEWRREWDLRSGKARIVKSLFGFDYATSKEFETNVSKWLARDAEAAKWVKVASGGNQLFVGCILYTENRVQWKLNGLDLPSLNDAGRANCRQEVAAGLLSTLEAREEISDVYDYCVSLGKALENVDWFENESTEFELLRRICDGPEEFLNRGNRF